MKDVTAAILVRDGRVLIAQRKVGDKLAGKWEFPGGKIEEGETPEECLTREMQEEFGITIRVGAAFGESIYRYEHGAIRLLAYWTYWMRGGLSLNVHDAVQWVLPSDLKNFDLAPADIPLAEALSKVQTNYGRKSIYKV